MTEKDILNLIEKDPWMMKVILTASSLSLPDWIIGAGFVRNKVWDYLHDRSREKVDTNDIDLVYYDPKGNDQKADEKLSAELQKQTGINWEIVNEHYAHVWNDLPPYTSAENAISTWPETVTAVGVTLRDGKLELIIPYGIDDLVNMVIRPSPSFMATESGRNCVRGRIEQKGWLQKWPKLTLAPF